MWYVSLILQNYVQKIREWYVNGKRICIEGWHRRGHFETKCSLAAKRLAAEKHRQTSYQFF